MSHSPLDLIGFLFRYLQRRFPDPTPAFLVNEGVPYLTRKIVRLSPSDDHTTSHLMLCFVASRCLG